jgi:hypothetical protein
VQHLEVLGPELIMVMPVTAKPVSAARDVIGAAPLDEGPLLRVKRTSIIGGLMSAFDPQPDMTLTCQNRREQAISNC